MSCTEPGKDYRSIFQSLTLIKNIGAGNYHKRSFNDLDQLVQSESQYSDLIFDSQFENYNGNKLKQG